MTVHFIGAGPGDPELLTLKAARVISECPVCLYAGSLVPEAVVAGVPEGAKVLDTAPMTLDEIITEIDIAHAAGQDIARVHSGDPSIYGAIAEQIRRLKDLGIPYTIVPGVPAFAAAAAAMGQELTAPEVAQTIILTRTAMKSSSMPKGEELASLGASGATWARHVSIRNLLHVERELAPHYGSDCPVVVAYRVGWPDETFIRGTLADIRDKVREAKLTRTALTFVGPILGEASFPDSALYDGARPHVLRPKKR